MREQVAGLTTCTEQLQNVVQAEGKEIRRLREETLQSKGSNLVSTGLGEHLSDESICAGMNQFFNSIQKWALQLASQANPKSKTADLASNAATPTDLPCRLHMQGLCTSWLVRHVSALADLEIFVERDVSNSLDSAVAPTWIS